MTTYDYSSVRMMPGYGYHTSVDGPEVDDWDITVLPEGVTRDARAFRTKIIDDSLCLVFQVPGNSRDLWAQSASALGVEQVIMYRQTSKGAIMPRKTKNQAYPQITVDDALRALRADYFTEIRSIALEALKQPEDDRDDWLHETLDGHERVIYTHAARVVLVCTDHPDAYQEEMGDDPETPSQAAFFAMRADVDDLLSNEYFIRDAKGEE